MSNLNPLFIEPVAVEPEYLTREEVGEAIRTLVHKWGGHMPPEDYAELLRLRKIDRAMKREEFHDRHPQ